MDATPNKSASDESKTVEMIYNMVCSEHDGIADFRAKLLALLPIASGAGLFLLLGEGADIELPHLLAVGLFGMLITIGLYFYELRGIQKCNALIRLGKSIEKDLTTNGRFIGRPPDLHIWRMRVGATQAALIIYPTIIAAWAYVATVGVVAIAGCVDVNALCTVLPALVAALLTFAAALRFGYVFDKNQARLLANNNTARKSELDPSTTESDIEY